MVLHGDAVERLCGAKTLLGREPRLVGLDVAAFEVGAGRDLGEGIGEESGKFAKVVLDALGRRRPQTQFDLGDVTARGLSYAGGDHQPARHRHRLALRQPGEGVQVPGVEERQLQAVELGRHGAA